MIVFVLGSFLAILLILFGCAFFIQAARSLLPFLAKGAILFAVLFAILVIFTLVLDKADSPAYDEPTETASDGSALVKLD